MTTPANVFYLTGFESSNAALLVDDARARLFSDFRYAEAARRVEDVEFVEVERSLLAGVARYLDGRVGFERANLTVAGHETLQASGAELVGRDNAVEQLRAVKDEQELAAIRRAAEITSAAYERLAQERFVGRPERELAWRMEQLFHELGAERAAFDIAMASGPNGATPHAHAGDRVIGAGELVVVDAGAVVDGYASDCTRTFATGALPQELEEVYGVVLEAQLAGLAAVAPQVHGREADAAARAVIGEAGYGEYFGHGLGHGLGLLVHEAPVLRPESTDVLAEGNVVTVEPGVYLPGRGGVRIEDLVVVREGGPEILTSFTKELVVVH